MNRFIGVDLGWYGKPSGLASIESVTGGLQLRRVDRLEATDRILEWICTEAGDGSAIVAVDAPLVILNQTGIREAERELNCDFRRFHAGCHAANLGRPFSKNVTAFSRLLGDQGFKHGASISPKQKGRFQIEVHPHAASVSLFELDRIVKYKRGPRDERARELKHLRKLMLSWLPKLEPRLALKLPSAPQSGELKPVEDRIDAVLCAYVGAYWWYWGRQKNHLYGNEEGGYIVVPRRLLNGSR